MRFKLDENLGPRLADLLRRGGHDVMLARDQGLGGQNDHVLIEVCRAENRILVTLDLDFSNILSFPPWRYRSTAVLRISEPTSWEKLEVAADTLLLGLEQRDIDHKLWIVDRGRIRESEAAEPPED